MLPAQFFSVTAGFRNLQIVNDKKTQATPAGVAHVLKAE
jgi:hypothetical protein